MILLCSANKFRMSWRLICLCKVPKEYIAQVFLYLFQQWLHINYSSVSSEKWKNAVCNSTSSFGFLLCWLGLGAVSEVSGALCKCISVGNAIAFTGIGRVFFGKVLISPSSSEVVHNSRSLWRVGDSSSVSGRGRLWAHFEEHVALGVSRKTFLATGGFQCLLLSEQWTITKTVLLVMPSSLCESSECQGFFPQFQKGPLHNLKVTSNKNGSASHFRWCRIQTCLQVIKCCRLTCPV